MYVDPCRLRQLSWFVFCAGTVSWKQRYTSWPRMLPGLDSVTRAGLFVRWPVAQLGLQLLALYTPVAWATVPPQLLHRRLPATIAPSNVR